MHLEVDPDLNYMTSIILKISYTYEDGPNRRPAQSIDSKRTWYVNVSVIMKFKSC